MNISAQKSRRIGEEPQEATKDSRSGVASLNGVTKKYGSVTALKEVSLEVRAGELLAVLGPNGAGKTTAVRLLLGLSRPDVGQARVFGGDPSRHAMRIRVGAMLQVAKVPETLKVKEHIHQFRGYYPNPLPYTEVIRSAGLEGLEDRLFGALSGGQKQRVLFALAICGNPDLVFLDEPTVGLDVGTRHLIWRQISALVQQRRTVVLTTHYLEEVDALADRVIVLNHGVIVAEGSSAEIKARTAQKKIRCVTNLLPDEITRISGVSGVTKQETWLEIRTTDAENVLRELLARDPGLSSLEISNSSLDDAFLNIIETTTEKEKQEVTA
jgi:ABC-2 type transport system ATP-binding protein